MTSFGNQAGTRPYKLYIPTGYAGKPLPMIVMLHGCTQTSDDFAAGTSMNACSRRGTRVLRALPGADVRGQPFAQGVRGRPLRRWSHGGGPGGCLPHLYAALGVHSGLAVGSAHDVQSAFAAMQGAPAARSPMRKRTSGPLPVIVFHGDRDTTVHPHNGEQVILESVDPAAASSVEQGRVPGGHAYTRTVHRDSTGRIVLEHRLGPDAAQAMLRFFDQSGRADSTP